MISIVEFGSEAIEYIRSELSFSYSKDLAQFLLDLPLENGKVFAYLPAELNREDIPPFKLSIFLTKSIEISHAIPAETRNFISTYLHSSIGKYAIFETLSEVGDTWLNSAKDTYFSCNSKVLLFLNHTDTEDEKVKSAIGGASAYPSIFILVESPLSIEHGKVISKDDLKALAQSVDHIIIGAFDEESYLIWSKP